MKSHIRHGFIQALTFADIEHPDHGLAGCTLSDKALQDIRNIVNIFVIDNESAIEAYLLAHTDHDLESVGRGLYFTLAGHGVGFWEQDSEHAKILDDWCEQYQSFDVYKGDDGALYVSYHYKLQARLPVSLNALCVGNRCYINGKRVSTACYHWLWSNSVVSCALTQGKRYTVVLSCESWVWNSRPK
jgi:hypothetical protein